MLLNVLSIPPPPGKTGGPRLWYQYVCMLHWNSNFKSNSQRVNFNILGSSKEWAGRDNHYKIEGENNKNSHRYGKRYLECLEFHLLLLCWCCVAHRCYATQRQAEHNKHYFGRENNATALCRPTLIELLAVLSCSLFQGNSKVNNWLVWNP